MTKIDVQRKGAINTLKNVVSYISGLIYDEGTSNERRTVEVNILGGDYPTGLPDDEEALLRDDTLSDIIEDDKLNVNDDTGTIISEEGPIGDITDDSAYILSSSDTLIYTQTTRTDGSQKMQKVADVYNMHYDETNIGEDGKIHLTYGATEAAIINNDTNNNLTLTIRGIPIILENKGENDDDIPNDFMFHGKFERFGAVTVESGSPDFDIYTQGDFGEPPVDDEEEGWQPFGDGNVSVLSEGSNFVNVYSVDQAMFLNGDIDVTPMSVVHPRAPFTYANPLVEENNVAVIDPSTGEATYSTAPGFISIDRMEYIVAEYGDNLAICNSWWGFNYTLPDDALYVGSDVTGHIVQALSGPLGDNYAMFIEDCEDGTGVLHTVQNQTSHLDSMIIPDTPISFYFTDDYSEVMTLEIVCKNNLYKVELTDPWNAELQDFIITVYPEIVDTIEITEIDVGDYVKKPAMAFSGNSDYYVTNDGNCGTIDSVTGEFTTLEEDVIHAYYDSWDSTLYMAKMAIFVVLPTSNPEGRVQVNKENMNPIGIGAAIIGQS